MKFKEFIIQIDLIILGLSISSSIEIFLRDFSCQTVLLFLTSITMCINFFHAKICELEHLSSSLKTLYINFMKLLPLCFISLSINNLKVFLFSLIALRFTDILGIFMDCKFNIRKCQRITKQWLIVDAISIIYLVLFVLNECVFKVTSSLVISILILVIWIVDVIIDYKEELKDLLFDLDDFF